MKTLFLPREVKLSEYDIRLAFESGKKRAERARGMRFTPKTSPEYVNILGCLGEVAVSVLTGLPWNCPYSDGPDDGRADVGDDLEVRAVDRTGKRLSVYPYEFPERAERRFVRVFVTPKKILVTGWYYGHEAKRDEHWEPKMDYPAWFVPNDLLHRELVV